MDFTIWASTDVGIRKETNQDSISLTVAEIPDGKCCFAVVCDGMGGLADGEVASGTVIREFRRWFEESFPVILAEGGDINETIATEWDVLCSRLNGTIQAHGGNKPLTQNPNQQKAVAVQHDEPRIAQQQRGKQSERLAHGTDQRLSAAPGLVFQQCP